MCNKLLLSLVHGLLVLSMLGCAGGPAAEQLSQAQGAVPSEQAVGDNTIAEYTKAIELNPNDAKAYVNRGVAYYTRGNLNQAVADFSKAIELDSQFATAYYNRGLAYKSTGNLDQARAYGLERV